MAKRFCLRALVGALVGLVGAFAGLSWACVGGCGRALLLRLLGLLGLWLSTCGWALLLGCSCWALRALLLGFAGAVAGIVGLACGRFCWLVGACWRLCALGSFCVAGLVGAFAGLVGAFAGLGALLGLWVSWACGCLWALFLWVCSAHAPTCTCVVPLVVSRCSRRAEVPTSAHMYPFKMHTSPQAAPFCAEQAGACTWHFCEAFAGLVGAFAGLTGAWACWACGH